MSVAIDQFWNLVAQSRLLDAAQIQHYQASLMQTRPQAAGDAELAGAWLTEQNAISSYQAKVLLAGKSGPFLFGEYRVYDRIVSGRLKGRFRAIHQPTGHLVLLEFLTGVLAQGGPAWNEAVLQVRAAAARPHANLTRLFEVVDLTTHKFLVVEDSRGQSLQERLEGGALSTQEACAIGRQAAMGAAHLHGANQVHGDVRPANVWLTQDGHVKLLHSPLEDTQVITPQRADYAAPELANPGALPTIASDVYAIGCTLYQSITGKPPYDGGDVGAKMRRHATEAIQPLESFGAPKPLADAVMYMMAKNVAVRIPNVQQVLDHLASFMGAAPQTPPQTPATQDAFQAHLAQKQTTQTASAPVRETAPVIVAPSESAAPIAIATDSQKSSLAEQRESSKKKGPPVGIIIGGVAGIALLAALLLFAMSGDGDNGELSGDPNGAATNGGNTNGGKTNGGDGKGAATGTNGNGTNGGGTNGNGNGQTTPTVDVGLSDDGKMLWVSPTAGDNIQFDYLPPGGQTFVILRPADMISAGNGAATLKALDAAMQGKQQRDQWLKRAGVNLDEISQLIISLHGNESRFPRMNYLFRLKTAKPVEELKQAWGAGEALKVEGRDYYKKGLYSFYPKADGSLFLMGAEEDVKECVSRDGAPPASRREIEQLRKVSDASRHLTVLFAPRFFSGDGLPLFEGDAKRAKEPLNWFLGDSIKAGLVSFHFSERDCYGELRLISEIGVDSHQLATQLQARINEIQYVLKEYVSFRVDPPDYWRRVAFALPGMVDFLHDQTRVGSEDGQAVLNFYLPGHAAPNLTFGGAMLMLSAPSRKAVAAGPQQVVPKTIEELLSKPASMSFDQQSLEFAMRDIAIDINESNPDLPFKFAIRINGDDLMGDGITRNQQISNFNAENEPLSAMLTTLVMKANPVTTVKLPTEMDQKLIWLITEDPDNAAQKIILITTRKGAAAKNLTLPATFVP